MAEEVPVVPAPATPEVAPVPETPVEAVLAPADPGILDRILNRSQTNEKVDNGGCMNPSCSDGKLDDEQVCKTCGFDRKLFNP